MSLAERFLLDKEKIESLRRCCIQEESEEKVGEDHSI